MLCLIIKGEGNEKKKKKKEEKVILLENGGLLGFCSDFVWVITEKKKRERRKGYKWGGSLSLSLSLRRKSLGSVQNGF